jgi:hypothetical protein
MEKDQGQFKPAFVYEDSVGFLAHETLQHEDDFTYASRRGRYGKKIQGTFTLEGRKMFEREAQDGELAFGPLEDKMVGPTPKEETKKPEEPPKVGEGRDNADNLRPGTPSLIKPGKTFAQVNFTFSSAPNLNFKKELDFIRANL